MLSEANFLILDEPTNHLDITSKEILEEALNNYEGTVLYVSHDRYFINKTATRILDLTNKKLVNYIGNYDYYLEKKEELTEIYAPKEEEEVTVEAVSATKLDWKQQKEEQARIRKRENELKKTEKAIEELETRDAQIDEEMSDPQVATNVAKCVELSREKAEIAEKLEELYESGKNWHSSPVLPFVLVYFIYFCGLLLSRHSGFQLFAYFQDKVFAVEHFWVFQCGDHCQVFCHISFLDNSYRSLFQLISEFLKSHVFI